MKKYAIVRIKGKQYKIAEKEELVVDKIEGKPEAEVLLVVENEKVKLGKPVVTGAKVDFKVIKNVVKGEKIKVFKFKAKSRYRKRMGFRPFLTNLLVEKISA